MTPTQAKHAQAGKTRVVAGFGEDWDTGFILAVHGHVADVGWESGVTTHTRLAELRVAHLMGGDDATLALPHRRSPLEFSNVPRCPSCGAFAIPARLH
jgi:hypothetical protein